MKDISTKPKPPSWKDLKRKVKGKCEDDGPFQDGEYEDYPSPFPPDGVGPPDEPD